MELRPIHIVLVAAVLLFGGNAKDRAEHLVDDVGQTVGVSAAPPPKAGPRTIVLVDQGPASLPSGGAYLTDFDTRAQAPFDDHGSIELRVIGAQSVTAGADTGTFDFISDPELAPDQDRANRSETLGDARDAMRGLLPTGAPCPARGPGGGASKSTQGARSPLLEAIPRAGGGTTVVVYSHGIENSGTYDAKHIIKDPAEAAARRARFLDQLMANKGWQPGALRGVRIVLPTMGIAELCARQRTRRERTYAELRLQDALALWQDFATRTGATLEPPS